MTTTNKEKRLKQPDWKFTKERQKSAAKAREVHSLVVRLGWEALEEKAKKDKQRKRSRNGG